MSLDIEPELLSRVQACIDDVRAGRMVILVDDRDAHSEGTLVVAADQVTPEVINFMATHARGLVSLSLTEERIAQLELPMMRRPGAAGARDTSSYTVSIEAARGVTTGISAMDRARTVQAAIAPNAQPGDLVTPGHVFPIKARPGGVLVRAARTEGSVDLARLAGRAPAGVLCDIMNDDGSMARLSDLEVLAEQHQLRILSVADLIRYRLQTERLIRRVDEGRLALTEGPDWLAIAYEAAVEGRQLMALVRGDVESSREAVLVRMHAGALLADTLGLHGRHVVDAAVRKIEAAGRGVLVYLPPRPTDLVTELRALVQRDSLGSSPIAAGADVDAAPDRGILREYGLGAQVLRDLGLQEITLLTNNPRRIPSVEGYGLTVAGTASLD